MSYTIYTPQGQYIPQQQGLGVYSQPIIQQPVYTTPIYASGRTPNFLDKLHDKNKLTLDRLGARVNNFANQKIGAESFCPMPLDLEVAKAARILRGFVEGLPSFSQQPVYGGPPTTAINKTLYHIPPEVIRNALGLAIFTTLRAGWVPFSGSGGSGIVIARRADGSWSLPSAIVSQTVGVGFMAGIDIMDCVIVINSEIGMRAFTEKARFTLGAEAGATAGPVGAGGSYDTGVTSHGGQEMFTYTKSKGLFLGIEVEGTVIAERYTENERYYGVNGVRPLQIFTSPNPPPPSMSELYFTLQQIESIGSYMPTYSPAVQSTTTTTTAYAPATARYVPATATYAPTYAPTSYVPVSAYGPGSTFVPASAYAPNRTTTTTTTYSTQPTQSYASDLEEEEEEQEERLEHQQQQLRQQQQLQQQQLQQQQLQQQQQQPPVYVPKYSKDL